MVMRDAAELGVIDGAVLRPWPARVHLRGGTWSRGRLVQVLGHLQMIAGGAEIGDVHQHVIGQLALYAEATLVDALALVVDVQPTHGVGGDGVAGRERIEHSDGLSKARRIGVVHRVGRGEADIAGAVPETDVLEEGAGAAANNGLPAVCWGPGETEARRVSFPVEVIDLASVESDDYRAARGVGCRVRLGHRNTASGIEVGQVVAVVEWRRVEFPPQAEVQ